MDRSCVIQGFLQHCKQSSSFCLNVSTGREHMDSTVRNLIKALLQCNEKGCITSVVYFPQIRNIGLIIKKSQINPKWRDILKNTWPPVFVCLFFVCFGLFFLNSSIQWKFIEFRPWACHSFGCLDITMREIPAFMKLAF